MSLFDAVEPAAERAIPNDDADELTWLLFRQDEVIAGCQARWCGRRGCAA